MGSVLMPRLLDEGHATLVDESSLSGFLVMDATHDPQDSAAQQAHQSQVFSSRPLLSRREFLRRHLWS